MRGGLQRMLLRAPLSMLRRDTPRRASLLCLPSALPDKLRASEDRQAQLAGELREAIADGGAFAGRAALALQHLCCSTTLR